MATECYIRRLVYDFKIFKHVQFHIILYHVLSTYPEVLIHCKLSTKATNFLLEVFGTRMSLLDISWVSGQG